jgi:hypothetical protein
LATGTATARPANVNATSNVRIDFFISGSPSNATYLDGTVVGRERKLEIAPRFRARRLVAHVLDES